VRFRRSSELREKVFDRELALVAVTVMLGALMSITDTTIVNVAIPTLGRKLHAPLSTVQWATTSYLLAVAVVIPLTRWVIDRIGTKRAYLGSLILFILGSILCGLASSPTTLIVFRAIQGLGGGLMVPVGQTILSRAAGPRRMGRVMTVVAAPSFLGIVIGPVIGGLILGTLGWRWIFYVNVPFGVVAVALAVTFLAVDSERARAPMDVYGLLLLPPGLALLIYGLSELGNVGSFSTTVLVGLVGGSVFIALFSRRALRISTPLVNLRLFGNRRFLTANLAAFVFTAAAGSGPLITTLYFQVGRGYSALGSGLFQSSLAFGAMATMPFAGRIIDRSGPRKVAIVGIVVSAASNIPWLFLAPNSSTSLLAVSLFVRGLGVGCVGTPLMAAGYAALNRSEMPTATTLSNISQRLGQAVGIAVIAVVLQRAFVADLPRAHASLDSIPTSSAGRRALGAGLSHAFSTTSWTLMVAFALSLAAALSLQRARDFERPDGVQELAVAGGADAGPAPGVEADR
jgi:EmrB/QacA subfamily drug resistance transporter